ncbi:porin [Phreatobacter stygius]|nr:porin [Phreatobacter stygius]
MPANAAIGKAIAEQDGQFFYAGRRPTGQGAALPLAPASGLGRPSAMATAPGGSPRSLKVPSRLSEQSLLLGTAAGFVAIAGAQAADLPGKAAPAEYVRICDTYGAGFFFIPGTDTCLRIGGFVRVDYTVNTTPGSRATGSTAVPGQRVLGTSYFDSLYGTSARLTLNFDARSNTEYGLLRAFGQFSAYRGQFDGAFSSQGLVNSGTHQSPRASAINVERAFIQFAGFTFGFSASFFNFYQGDVQLSGNFAATARSTTVLAYTASFGSGFSATVSLEDSMYRRYGNQDVWVDNAAGANITPLTRPLSGVYGLTYGAQKVPDIVANLRVDQAWGSAQIMGALHQLTDYGYAGTTTTQIPALTGQNFGNPTNAAGDKFGWAVGAGVRLNLDMLARGDVLWLQAVYADGALDYAFGTANQGGDRQTISGAGNLSGVNALNSQLRDAVVANNLGGVPVVGNASIQTTKAWSVAAGFRHFWTPALRSSIFGAYSDINQPAAAVGLSDIKYWNVGVNTIWSPVRNLDLGLEVVYHNINARTQAGLVPAISGGGVPRGQEGAWVGTLRVQRNF